MDLHSLREEQAKFQKRYNELEELRQPLYKLRDRFRKYFTPKKMRELQIDEYAIGRKLAKRKLNFCYTLERELESLGRITGSPAFKFGVYYGRTKSDQDKKYRFSKKFGSTVNEAFINVIASIVELVDAGKRQDLAAITKSRLAQTFKGKILSVYFPERYLSIFSKDHLDKFLGSLNIEIRATEALDFVVKQELLLEYKKSDPVFRTWSIDLFVHFLYHVFPEVKASDSLGTGRTKEILSDYVDDDFPATVKPQILSMEVLERIDRESGKSLSPARKKIDYEKLYRRCKRIGDRGEKIVFDLENERLKMMGKNPKDLVKWVSREDDSLGYDITSVNESGREVRIEVKSTTSKPGRFDVFLSANELETAREEPNFELWIVFEVNTPSPKVWKVGNPFKTTDSNFVLTPISFKVSVNAKVLL